MGEAEGQLLLDRGEEDLVVGVLEEDADLGEGGFAVAGGVGGADPDGARDGGDEAGEEAEEGGLARAVLAEDAERAGGRDLCTRNRL